MGKVLRASLHNSRVRDDGRVRTIPLYVHEIHEMAVSVRMFPKVMNYFDGIRGLYQVVGHIGPM